MSGYQGRTCFWSRNPSSFSALRSPGGLTAAPRAGEMDSNSSSFQSSTFPNPTRPSSLPIPPGYSSPSSSSSFLAAFCSKSSRDWQLVRNGRPRPRNGLSWIQPFPPERLVMSIPALAPRPLSPSITTGPSRPAHHVIFKYPAPDRCILLLFPSHSFVRPRFKLLGCPQSLCLLQFCY